MIESKHIIRGESNRAYHANGAFGSSALKQLLTDWEIFKAKYVDRTMKSEETAAMRRGSAFHKLVLENDDFSSEYAILPEGFTARSSANKQVIADYEEQGIIALKASEYKEIAVMAESVNKNKAAKLMLTGGEAELGFRLNYGAYALQCRTDYFVESATAEQAEVLGIKEGDAYIADLKSTGDINAWMRDNYGSPVHTFCYDLQAALYLSVANTVMDIEELPQIKHFFFVVTESKEPYRTRVHRLKSLQFDLGLEKVKRAIEPLTKGLKTGVFGESYDGVIEIGMNDSIIGSEFEALARVREAAENAT